MSYAIQSQVQLSQDLASLPRINAVNGPRLANTPDEIQAVAKEFESLFMNMMLKSMRSANRTLSEGNYFNSFESKMYEDMLDEKLSVELSHFGSLGIADLLVKQLSADHSSRTYDLKMGQPSATLFPSERRSAFDSPRQFVEQLMPKAKKAAAELGINPEFIVAQAALETGWGKQVMFDGDGNNSFNLFGIKAKPDWQGRALSIDSMEVIDGIAAPKKSQFKMYDSYEQGLKDYQGLLQTERYRAVSGAQNIESFAAALQRGGYATDPAYGAKLARVMKSVDQLQLAESR